MAYLNQEIIVNSDGELIVSVNGRIRTTPELLTKIRNASLLSTPIQFIIPYGNYYHADITKPIENEMGLLAALFAPNPGRTDLVTAPASILNKLDEEYLLFDERNFDND